MVRCEEDRKKQTTEDMIMEMKPADSSLKDMMEYVMERVWVSREMETMR